MEHKMKTKAEAEDAVKELHKALLDVLIKNYGLGAMGSVIASVATAKDFIRFIYDDARTPAESLREQFKASEDAASEDEKRGTEIRNGLRLPIED